MKFQPASVAGGSWPKAKIFTPARRGRMGGALVQAWGKRLREYKKSANVWCDAV